MSKSKRNNKLVSPAVKEFRAGVAKRYNELTKSEVINELTAPVDTTPLQITAPVIDTAPVSAPPVSAGLEMGVPNLASKRVTPGTQIDNWRICSSQRKTDTAKYYIQAGSIRVDPGTQREMFMVAIEIPHVDLYTAKLQLAKLRAELSAQRAIDTTLAVA